MKLVHIILTFILFGVFTGLSHGQPFHAGVFLGGNVSQVDGDGWQGYDKFGWQAGGFVQLKPWKHSSFQMEVGYIQKGARKNTDLETEDLNFYLLRLNYFSIPVLYQFSFANRFSFEIGPAADIMISHYEEGNDGLEVETTVPFRPVTLDGIIGFNAYITSHLKANFRWHYNLLSIRNGTAPGFRDILFEVGQYNNVLALSLYWDFKPNDFRK